MPLFQDKQYSDYRGSMANENEHFTVIAAYMQLCANCNNCNAKSVCVWTNFNPFPLHLCNTAAVLLPVCTIAVTLLQLLHSYFLQAIISAAMRSEPGNILDAGMQGVDLKEFSDGEWSVCKCFKNIKL